jgi:CheY-specific phosphatase CheX
MTPALDNSLRDAAMTTFEQVVFLLADSPPDEAQRAKRVLAVATVAFSGPATGVLQVRACEGLLPRLTANMLGVAGASEGLQLDALGEIANIICGQLFPRLAPDCVFAQLPPQVAVGADAGDSANQPAAACVELGLESSRADILLFLYGTDELVRTIR